MDEEPSKKATNKRTGYECADRDGQTIARQVIGRSERSELIRLSKAPAAAGCQVQKFVTSGGITKIFRS